MERQNTCIVKDNERNVESETVVNDRESPKYALRRRVAASPFEAQCDRASWRRAFSVCVGWVFLLGCYRTSVHATDLAPDALTISPIATTSIKLQAGQFMARISFVEERDHPELAELIGKIKAGRHGTLLNIYKLLLHSPPLAATWLEHLAGVRWKTRLDGRIRELAIIRIAYRNRIAYVLQQHVPTLALADGVSLDECKALADWRG